MRRAGFVLTAMFAAAATGCLDKEDPMGMLRLQLMDGAGDVAFEMLTTSVERIVLTMNDGMRMEEMVEGPSIDLSLGEPTTVYDGGMMAGDYKRVDVYLREGRGTLADGTTATILAPNGRVYVDSRFSIPADEMLMFVFEVQVEDLGGGQYRFVSNPMGSGPGGMG